jgi:hypothetical protein
MKGCLKQFEWRRRLRRLGVGLGIGARLVIITAQRSAERSMHPPGNPQTRDVHRIYREPRFLYRGFKVQVIVPLDAPMLSQGTNQPPLRSLGGNIMRFPETPSMAPSNHSRGVRVQKMTVASDRLIRPQ